MLLHIFIKNLKNSKSISLDYKKTNKLRVSTPSKNARIACILVVYCDASNSQESFRSGEETIAKILFTTFSFVVQANTSRAVPLSGTLKETSQNQKQIFTFIQSFNEQLSDLNKIGKEQDKKLSNFLSTQLNIQSSTLQLTTELSKKGLVDSETKKILKNIDKGIQLLRSNSKKK